MMVFSNKIKMVLIFVSILFVVSIWRFNQSPDQPSDNSVSNQEIVRGNGAEPASLDPGKAEGSPESAIIRDMFEGLVIQNRDGEVIPGVAHKWEMSPDGLSYTFHLRDTKWTNSEPLTAHDFVYAWQRLADPKTGSAYSWYLEITHIQHASDVIEGKSPPSALGVKALDDQTLQISLDQQVPYFTQMLGHFSLMPVHQQTIEQHGDQWTKPGNIVSNGAYKLDKWIVNGRVVLVRNPYYWDNGNTTINKVTFLPTVSESSELNQYLAGQIDMTYTLPVDQFARMLSTHKDEVKVTGFLGSYYYDFNTQASPFNDVRVRRAFSYAIDRDILTKKVTKRGELSAYNFTPDIVAGFVPDQTQWEKLSQTERNAQATKLLKEANFDYNQPIKVLYNTNEGHKKVAIAIASMWKTNLGVTVELVNEEWKTFLETKKGTNWTIARAGWLGDYNEPSAFLALLTCDNVMNASKWCNRSYEDLLLKSLNATDKNELNVIYNKMESLIANEHPIAPIYQYVRARMLKPHVGGYARNAEDRQYTKNLYIKEK